MFYITFVITIPFTDNLEVADEILDVNERKLESESRSEVIKHIHEVRTFSHDQTLTSACNEIYFQCIQSCMIKLRVKRRSDSKLGKKIDWNLRIIIIFY